MCDPTLVTLLKIRPHCSQSSRKNATPSSGTSPLASYEEVTPRASAVRWPLDWLCVQSSRPEKKKAEEENNKRKRRREDVKEREKEMTGSLFPASALFLPCSTYTPVYPPFSWQVIVIQAAPPLASYMVTRVQSSNNDD